jgi:hypothetical protein
MVFDLSVEQFEGKDQGETNASTSFSLQADLASSGRGKVPPSETLPKNTLPVDNQNKGPKNTSR